MKSILLAFSHFLITQSVSSPYQNYESYAHISFLFIINKASNMSAIGETQNTHAHIIDYFRPGRTRPFPEFPHPHVVQRIELSHVS